VILKGGKKKRRGHEWGGREEYPEKRDRQVITIIRIKTPHAREDEKVGENGDKSSGKSRGAPGGERLNGASGRHKLKKARREREFTQYQQISLHQRQWSTERRGGGGARSEDYVGEDLMGKGKNSLI